MAVFIRSFEPSRLEQVYMIITRDCNLHCAHCVRGHNRDEARIMRTADFCYVLSEIAKLQPCVQLIISGGEPTIHPDFIELARQARQVFERVTLVTNGTKLHSLEQVVNVVPDIRIQVSVDGNEAAHDNIRGVGTYRRTMAAIIELACNGVDVWVSTTVNRQNAFSIAELFLDLSVISINCWKVSPEIAAGAANTRVSEHLPWDEWNFTVSQIQRMTVSWPRNVIAKTMFSFVGRDVPWSELPQQVLDGAGCGAGIKRFYVYPNLSVIGCPHLVDYKLGDLRNQPLFEILNGINSSIMSELEFDTSTPCGSCEYFKICRGGCLGASLSRYGYLNRGDPRCPIVSASLT